MPLNEKVLNVSRKDSELFLYLHAVKVATFTQINENVYKYPVIHVLYKRLRKFEKDGFINGIYHYKTSPQKIYRLTKQGFLKFVSDGTEQRIEIGSNAVMHDLRLGDIRWRLLKDNIAVTYMTENTLKTWENLSTDPLLLPYVQVNCDAVAEIPVGRGIVRFAVEYEASKKHWNRYSDILDNYYSNPGIPFVIYVCEDGSLIRDLKSKDRNSYGDQDPKIFYITADQILKSNTVELTNRNGKILDFSPMPERSEQGQSLVNVLPV